MSHACLAENLKSTLWDETFSIAAPLLKKIVSGDDICRFESLTGLLVMHYPNHLVLIIANLNSDIIEICSLLVCTDILYVNNKHC